VLTAGKWRWLAALLTLGIVAFGLMAPLPGQEGPAGDERPVVAARANTIDGQQVGELTVDGQVAIRVREGAGGYSPAERAEIAARRLDQAIGEGAGYQDIAVGRVGQEWAVLAKGSLIITADAAHARMNGTTPSNLAQVWRTNLVNALLGKPVQADPAPVKPGEIDWSESGKKIVPILDVGNRGVSIGAAQVVGPRAQVDQVKAVAQLELDVKHQLRAKVYVPVSSINITKLDRVQGCSVWAIGDLRLLKF
jgi:hypothetical protein